MRIEGCKVVRGFVGYGYWGVKRIIGIISLWWFDYNWGFGVYVFCFE